MNIPTISRFGIGYRSQIKHKLKGNIDFSKAVDMDQNILRPPDNACKFDFRSISRY